VEQVTSQRDEPLIIKQFPTRLCRRTSTIVSGTQNPALVGSMAHMCVKATARGAFNLGYTRMVMAGAAAARPLRGPSAVVSAEAWQAGSLAAIADRFGIVVQRSPPFLTKSKAVQ
jgi:hypothetical protein